MKYRHPMKRYEYKKALRDAAAGMASIRNSRQLPQLIVHLVGMRVPLEHISIFVYQDKLKQYRLMASRGKEKLHNAYAGIEQNDSLVEWLKKNRRPILIYAADSPHIQKSMQMLNASACFPSLYGEELLAILVLGNKRSRGRFSKEELGFFSALTDEATIALKNSQLYFELEEKAREIERLCRRENELFTHTAVAFAAAIDARDPYTHGHSERVTSYSISILDYLKPGRMVENKRNLRQRLQIAAVLHDIGKIGIADDILYKPTDLSSKERKEIERHAIIGADIVSHIKGLADIVGGIRHHHEWHNGAGYPDGLKADEIPLMAKVISVADAYDAIISARPYRKEFSVREARDEIESNSSIQFDPNIVEAFLKAFESGEIYH